MQLEIGISTSRYFPASGTAGLERSLVSGNRRLPCPPPIMTESTLPTVGAIRLLCISAMSASLYNPLDVPSASGDGEPLGEPGASRIFKRAQLGRSQLSHHGAGARGKWPSLPVVLLQMWFPWPSV